MKAYGYIRVSTEGQKESGLGVEAQTAVVRRAYELHLAGGGYGPIKMMIDEAVSRKLDLSQRPKGAELIALLQPGDVVVMPRIDRTFGTIRDLANQLDCWDRLGVRIVSTDLAGGWYDSKSLSAKILVTILGLASEIEHASICTRNQDRIRAMRAQGLPICRYPPPGLKIVHLYGKKRYQPNDEERKVMALIYDWHYNRNSSYSAISAHLNEQGVRFSRDISKRGRNCKATYCKWTKLRVQRFYEAERFYREAEPKLQPGQFVVPPDGIILRRHAKESAQPVLTASEATV